MNYLQQIKIAVEKEIEVLKREIAKAKKSMAEAPKRNEARYDSSHAEYQYMVAALENKLVELMLLLGKIPKEIPKTGNLWKKFDKYILVPEGFGGRKIEDIFLVSVNSPIGQKLSLPHPSESNAVGDEVSGR